MLPCMRQAKTIVHVNLNVIRDNLRTGMCNPPITVKSRGQNVYAHAVEILGPSQLVYRPDKPLSCGARLWLETHAQVVCDGQPRPPITAA
jgi:hypothetical protein